jgi:hypothetical protein
MAEITDAERIDWLEREMKSPGGLLLHDERRPTGRRGLGLLMGQRTLRDAIDMAMRAERAEVSTEHL